MNLIFVFVILFLALSPSVKGAEDKMLGSATCSAAACHGGTSKKKNEFTIWSTQDKHRKAYGVLFDPRSQKMATILGLKQKAYEDDFCLSCHAVKASAARGPRYDLQEGVSCEACHGGSEKWLEPHAQKGWTHAQSVNLGLTDLKDPRIRAETCLRCHGTIDHRLLSAGHPDIVFELDTFSAMMPKHWEEKSAWSGAKSWAFGQILALRQHLKQLEKLAQEGRPFDEGFKNCFACHHNIYDVKWSLNDQASGKAAWNHARDMILLDFLKVAFPDHHSIIAPKIAFLEQAFSAGTSKPGEIIEAAREIASRLDEIAPRVAGRPWGPTMVTNLIRSIAQDSGIATQGYHVAEQAFMALDTLSLALQKEGVAVASLRKAVKAMGDTLDIQDPSRYDPQAFQKSLEDLKTLLSREALEPSLIPEKKIVNPKGWWGKTHP